MNRTKDHKSIHILVIDDNPSIHEDFQKILGTGQSGNDNLEEAENILFGESSTNAKHFEFEIASAYQGQEGLELLENSLREGRPFAMAFVDVRMPPGWDGIETVQRLWQVYPQLQVVICTAYSDYSWHDITKTIGNSDNMLILKKPFDNIEILQLSHALTKKWMLTKLADSLMEDLDQTVNERTQELEQAHQKLTHQQGERLKMETALHHSEQRFSKAFRASPLPMAIQLVPGDQIIAVNDSFLCMTGYDHAEIESHTPEEIGLWTNAITQKKILSQLQSEKSVFNLECSIQTRSGEVRETLVYVEQFNLGTDTFLLLIIQDITDRINLESQLRQAQKMEAVGRLAAGIAHDFNNILTVIQGSAHLLIRENSFPAQFSKSVEHIIEAADRASTLTRQVLQFSRKHVIQPKVLDLNALVKQVSKLLARVIGENKSMEFQYADTLPPIFVDECNLEQVIMNLVVNASDASLQGGRLTISTECVEINEPQAAQNTEATVGRYVCLSVADEGCGMDAHTRRHIFDPFFTTKDVGKGTGMGLATVYGIVKQHQGWIEVESEVGQGSTFRVYLPETDRQPDAIIVELPETHGNEEKPTILLAEDKEDVREVVLQILNWYDYDVLVAEHGDEAWRIWQQHTAEIGILLTDVVMPGELSGRDLAVRLTQEKPDLKVIFMSGYSADEITEDLELQTTYHFLRKPFLPSELIRSIRECLQTQPAGELITS